MLAKRSFSWWSTSGPKAKLFTKIILEERERRRKKKGLIFFLHIYNRKPSPNLQSTQQCNYYNIGSHWRIFHWDFFTLPSLLSPCVCYSFLPFFRQKVSPLQLTKTIKAVYMFIFKSWVLLGTPHLLCTPHVSSHTISSTLWTLYPWSVKKKSRNSVIDVNIF